MAGEPRTKEPLVQGERIDLARFTPKERELLVDFASLLLESRDAGEGGDDVLRLWHAFASKPPAVADQNEADRLALEAVAEVRGRV